jgi:hypothetical protein
LNYKVERRINGGWTYFGLENNYKEASFGFG